jgi:hypothetical protein
MADADLTSGDDGELNLGQALEEFNLSWARFYFIEKCLEQGGSDPELEKEKIHLEMDVLPRVQGQVYDAL